MAPFSREEPGETDSGETVEASVPATLDPLTAPLAEVLGEAPHASTDTHLSIFAEEADHAEDAEDADEADHAEADEPDEAASDDVEPNSDSMVAPRPTVADLPIGVVDVEDFSPSARVDVFAALRGDSEPVEPEPGSPEPTPEPEPASAGRFETLEELLASATRRSHSPQPEPVRAAAEVQPDPEPEPVSVPPVPEPEPVPVLPEPEPEPEPEPVQTAVLPAVVATPSESPTASMPVEQNVKPTVEPDQENVDLSPRGSSRALLLALLGLAAVATAALAWWASQHPSTTTLVLAGVAVVVTLALWRAHGRSAPSTVMIERGNLDIRTRDSHHRFDLASPTTKYETVGTPGGRGWKVLIHRTGMPPYVVDASLVDAAEFTRVLERLQRQETGIQ
ncbi:hypothetical protein [Nocardioides sp. Root140]|uniref:hypothetical protein n=1 Tax=Nocardioides sp. Root140 TaxID=1736460 RepID=UPI0006FCC965|nr:hypothetical protein [Nocardioides sp. Root140]KQY56965.1 hypothetical protein ASD30_11875 [Nocardioides sp. Root140]